MFDIWQVTQFFHLVNLLQYLQCLYFRWQNYCICISKQIFQKILLFLIFVPSCFLHATAIHIDRESLHHFFSDILLIINFNHPHYDNKEFLKEIYSPYFSNIVFYGEKPEREIYAIKHEHGLYVHKAIRDAMKRWPHYKGYICCQDDCFMNFWNLQRLDKNKIWFHHYWIASLNSSTHWWPWWQLSCGYQAAIRAYQKLSGKALKNLEKNCGSFACAFSQADFIYVPAKYSNEFIKLSRKFENPDVFLEIALPTILLSLEEFDNMEKLNICWAGTINSIDLNKYDPSFDWIHPIKFSQLLNRDFIRQLLSPKG